MKEIIFHFFEMGGYAFYVWSAYAMVFLFLIITWLVPFFRFKKYLSQTKINHEPHS